MTYLRFGIRDLLWSMLVVAMGLGWHADRSRLKEAAYYLDWKAYHLVHELDTAEKVEVDEEGNLFFEHANGIQGWKRFPLPHEADRRKVWDEFRSMSDE